MLIPPRIFNKLNHQSRGVATIETALALPFLVVMILFGGFELWQILSSSLRLDRATNQVASAAARSPVGITEGEVTSILKAAERSAVPTELYKGGRVIISAVEARASQKILWQRCMGDLTAFKGSIGGVGEKAKFLKIKFAGPPEDVLMIVVESEFEYNATFAGSIFPSLKLGHGTVAIGRDALSSSVVPKGTASNC